MDLASVAAEIAEQLNTIGGLRAFPSPVDKVTPPTAMVLYPDEIEFDATYGRGMDRITLPVLIVIGRLPDRATTDRLSAYASGSGASSVKQVIEAGTYTAFDTVRVESAEIDGVVIAGTDYVGITFTLDIAGDGAQEEQESN